MLKFASGVCFSTKNEISTLQPFPSRFAPILTVLLAFLLSAFPATAQLAGTGAISGTVTDPTGAAIPGATVTAVNVDTNLKTVRTSTGAGDYDITPLLPGNYTVTFAAKGFEAYVQQNVTVNALSTVPLTVKLTIGAADQSVTVSAAPPVISTTDATLGGVMDNEMYSNLPLQMGQGGNADQRRATDFEYLMPGVQGNFTSNNSTSNSGIVNGSGPTGGVSDIYVDGVDLPEADQVGDPRFTWTAIGVDAVDSFQVQTAGISSQYGGQGMQNYTIKSGTNGYHGSIYEYNRNTLFDAWQFQNKIPTLNAQGVTIPGGIKPREIQNEFGIVVNGPIIKDKLFLFGNYGQYRYQHGATYAPVTIPIAAELGYTQTGQALGYADFTAYSAPAAQGGSGAGIYDPATQTPGCSTCTRAQFMGMKNGIATPNVIPGNRISQAASVYNKFLLPYEPLTNQTLLANNLVFGTPTGLSNWYSTGSIDYDQSAKHRMRFLIAFGRQAATGLNSTSGLLPPFNTSQIYNPVTTVDMLRDTYTITDHIINQAAIAFGRYQSDSVGPNRQPQYSATNAGILNMPSGQASDGFPSITWSGSFDNPGTWGGYAWNNKINNTYNVTDNLQWVKGKHNFTFGAQLVETQFDYYKVVSPSGPMGFQFASTQTANYTTGSSTNSNAGYSVASYMIGAVNSSSDTVNSPGLGTRWLDPSMWAEDDWKVRSNLTLNIGLRWDIFPSIHEVHNIFTYLNPTGANSVTGNLGTLEFAGNSVTGASCNCKNPSPTQYKNFGPRLGMAFTIDPKTVFHASYNVNIARGDWTSGSQSGSPSTLGITPGATAPAGISGAPSFYWDSTQCALGTANGTACGWTGSIVAPAPPAGGTSLAEYGTGETVALGNGTALGMTYFDPYRGARTPQYINWGVGLQRQLTKDMSVSVNYVGSQGHYISGGYVNPARTNRLTTNFATLSGYNLIGTTATPCTPGGATGCGLNGNTTLLGSKATATAIAAVEGQGFTPPNPYTNGQSYYASNGVTGYFTQFPQFSGVSDTTNFNGNTDFHAFELTVRQRAAHGLDFMLNYTFSKSIDDVGTFRLNDNPRLDRSLSVTDEPENLTATGVYQSPFGKGKMGGENFIIRALASGWIVSGIFSYHSGTPLVATGSGCGGAPLQQCMPSAVPGVQARQGKYGSNVVANPTASNYYGAQRYINPAAFCVNQPGALATIGTTVTTVNGCVNYVGNGPALYVPGTAQRVGADNVWSMSFYDVDFALKRTFPVYEKMTLQFEVDMLNATNHVVWPALNGGVAGSTLGEVGAPSNFARDFQLSGRFAW